MADTANADKKSTPLIDAVKKQDLNEVTRLLGLPAGQRGFGIDDADAEGYTALHHAMNKYPFENHANYTKELEKADDITRLLLADGANRNFISTGEYKKTPLQRAHHPQAVTTILTECSKEERAKLLDNIEGTLFKNPLNAAVRHGFLDTLKKMHELGGDLTLRTPEGGNIFHTDSPGYITDFIVSKIGDEKTKEMLIEHDKGGENIFHKINNVYQAERFTKIIGDEKTKEMLVARDINGQTPLHKKFTYVPKIYELEFYLNKGANINALDNLLHSPVDVLTESIKSPIYKDNSDSRAYQQEAMAFLKQRGAKSGQDVVDEQLTQAATKYPSVKALLAGEKVDIVAIQPLRASDFKNVPVLPPTKELGPPVMIVVIERTADTVRGTASEHILHTGYIANGVFSKLTGRNDAHDKVIAIQEHLSEGAPILYEHLESPIAKLMKRPEVRQGSVIFSHSMGTWDALDYHSNLKLDFEQAQKASWAKLNPVIYKAAGNGQDDGPSRQDRSADADVPRVMRIGAVTNNGNLKKYTEEGAVVTAPIPTHNGEVLEGTSFSTPAGAAVHGAIVQRYGKWAQNPYGVTPEEVEWTIIASADKKVVDDTTGKIAKFDRNNEGILHHDRAGFGNINPIKADALAKELFEYKRKNQLDSESKNFTATIRAPGSKDSITPDPKGLYEYKIKVPEAVWVGNMNLDLGFEKIGNDEAEQRNNNKGKTRLVRIECNGKQYNANLSIGGTATVSGMMGIKLPKDAEITIRTELPLTEGYMRFNVLDPKANSIEQFMQEKRRTKYPKGSMVAPKVSANTNVNETIIDHKMPEVIADMEQMIEKVTNARFPFQEQDRAVAVVPRLTQGQMLSDTKNTTLGT